MLLPLFRVECICARLGGHKAAVVVEVGASVECERIIVICLAPAVFRRMSDRVKMSMFDFRLLEITDKSFPRSRIPLRLHLLNSVA